MALDLEAIELIKQLKARYFRFLDTRNIAGLHSVFTEDASARFKGPDYDFDLTGWPALEAFYRKSFSADAFGMHTMPVQGQYHPYSLERLSKAGRAVMREAGLSDELRLSDLRRTGTTQMVEAGVPMGQIMSVTGHANPSSVKPYMKNTRKSAELALTARKNS